MRYVPCVAHVVVPHTHTHTHTSIHMLHNFYNQTDICVCVCVLLLLSCSHTTRSVLLQIKLISQKLLPTNAAVIVLFALTNCFCFQRAAFATSLNWVRIQQWGCTRGCLKGLPVWVPLFSALLIVHCDCPCNFLRHCGCVAFCSCCICVRKLICAFYVTLLLLALTRY